jgi:coproporphyrinogen III oxidase-like Fe-S oxidoreductase
VTAITCEGTQFSACCPAGQDITQIIDASYGRSDAATCMHADMYELADDLFTGAGYEWYEVSNWAKDPASRSLHNLSYWQGTDWWGFGPGAHSHLNGVRWWNVKHPAAYSERIRAGESPALEREILDDEQRVYESVLLGVRVRDGSGIDSLGPRGRDAVAGLIEDRAQVEIEVTAVVGPDPNQV